MRSCLYKTGVTKAGRGCEGKKGGDYHKLAQVKGGDKQQCTFSNSLLAHYDGFPVDIAAC